MKYLFYGLLCLMFAGCDGCRSMLSCWGCSDREIDLVVPAKIHEDHPLAFLFSLNGLDLNVSSPSPDGSSNNYQSDYSLDFGFKYFLDSRNAIRAGASLNIFSDGKDQLPHKVTTIGPYIGYEHHCISNYPVSPYLGVGAAYSSWTITNPMTEGINSQGLPKPQATTTGDITDKSSLLRLQVMGGFDWYPFNAFAIGAEYSLAFTSLGSSHTDAAGVKTDNPTSTTFGIVGGGNVHLLVHF